MNSRELSRARHCVMIWFFLHHFHVPKLLLYSASAILLLAGYARKRAHTYRFPGPAIVTAWNARCKSTVKASRQPALRSYTTQLWPPASTPMVPNARLTKNGKVSTLKHVVSNSRVTFENGGSDVYFRRVQTKPSLASLPACYVILWRCCAGKGPLF